MIYNLSVKDSEDIKMILKHKLSLMLAASAILTGLAVAFPKIFGIFEWVSMIPMITVLCRLTEDEGVRLRRAYALGLLYFELFYMVGWHFFLYLYPLDFTGLDNFTSVIAIAVAWLGLSFLQAFFGGFAFVLFVAVGRSRLVKRYPVLAIVRFPVIYAFYEFTQTLGWWGVPWSRLPIGQSELLLPIMSASLFGSYFITALIVLVNALLAFALMHKTELTHVRSLSVIALSVFAANIILGGVLFVAEGKRAEGGERITVGIVQGNYDSTEKWYSSPLSILERHLDYTEKCAEDGAELVVWAETALPYNLDPDSFYADEIRAVAMKYEITVFVGCMHYKGAESYNSVLAFLPDGTIDDSIYYKQRLVPFGEYVPMRNIVDVILPFLSEISMLSDDMTPGTESTVFDTELGKIGSLICFDSIYEELARESVLSGAELIALSTNDSWFSDSAGIYMHNAQAKLRSIELGRYTVRCANTGLSSFITSRGETAASLPPLTEGYLVSEAVMLSHTTLYAAVGNVFVYICGALCLAPPIYSLIVHIRKRTENGERSDTGDTL